MSGNLRIQGELFENLVVPFEYFNGVPSLAFCRHIVKRRFLDMSECVFHRT